MVRAGSVREHRSGPLINIVPLEVGVKSCPDPFVSFVSASSVDIENHASYIKRVLADFSCFATHIATQGKDKLLSVNYKFYKSATYFGKNC